MDKKIYAKVFLFGNNPLILPLDILEGFLREEFYYAEDCENYSITFSLMTEEEYKNLPEHTGW